MAVLPDTERADLSAEIQRELSRNRATTILSKPEMRTLINAMDDYLETNKVAINTAIPLPVRGNATTAEKALAMSYVALRRYEKGS
jgi:hypothetical protein